MSSITPLLDTLLHDVLGKRSDPPAQRQLNEAVRPSNPGEALPAVRSDSRLDARRPPPPEVSSRGTQRAADAPPRSPPTQQPPAQSEARATNLSPAARIIGNVLNRFPAPPSVLRPQAPLLPSPLQANPTVLADRLQGSISESGLFYESHLARWYRRDVPIQQLQREPQALLARAADNPSGAEPRGGALHAFAGAAVGGKQAGMAAREGQVSSSQSSPSSAPSPANMGGKPAGEPSPAGRELVPVSGVRTGAASAVRQAYLMGPPQPATQTPAGQPIPVGQQMSAQQQTSTGQQAPAGQPSASVPTPGPAARPALAETGVSSGPTGQGMIPDSADTPRGPLMNEAMQGLVRHQLELLATPVLRWEGDVWSGIFMALLIQAPPAAGERHHGGRDDDAEEGKEGSEGWQTQIALDVAGLGSLRAAMSLQGERLELQLRAESEPMLRRLEAGRDGLMARLRRCGYPEAVVGMMLDRGDGHE